MRATQAGVIWALCLALVLMGCTPLPAALPTAPAATATEIPTATPPLPTATNSLAPAVIHAAAATATSTRSATPPSSPTPPSSSTPLPTARPTASATSASAATLPPVSSPVAQAATATNPPPHTATLAPTAIATLSRRVVLAGQLEALRRNGQVAWAALALECRDAAGELLGRVPLTATDATYALPADTARVRLWIGYDLGSAVWWNLWDSQEADAAPETITLTITQVATSGGGCAGPTATPDPGG